jgi:CRISPR/Cas system CSM-associated protein Csm3 (group 7 of RAMP superfamily)
MTLRLTLFTATLVQDSALSVSGLDRETSADQPFALVDGVPTLVGRGLKGAAVAMAGRFFKPLPRAVSDAVKEGEERALRRSAWEFSDATLEGSVRPVLRAGVGIRHKTGARAGGVLYDREVIPAGTTWQLCFRVDWSQIPEALRAEEEREAEGILGYVLAEHWTKGRCWLGGGVARGLGWCHLDDLKAYRLDETAYEAWVQSGRTKLPAPLATVPTVRPTRSWCFRTLDVDISFGEYKPDANEAAWGLDMFAVGPHDTERALQLTGDGSWARPAWAMNAATPDVLSTDRALAMEGNRPLLPGASVRGPLRHAFSRLERAKGHDVKDPHVVQGDVGKDDPAGKAFGTVNQSSRILIRDARAEAGWAAAKLHMHAEDEFSAGSYGSAKRDAVRMLRGTFPVRIVIEGPTVEEVEPLVTLINRQVALGALGHLFLGGHKTRGAGAGHWQAKGWVVDDVAKVRSWTPPETKTEVTNGARSKRTFIEPPDAAEAWVRSRTGAVTEPLTLGTAAKLAKAALGEKLVAWWCDPTIDLALTTPPKTFGRTWPSEDDTLQLDEVAFYAERAVWRAARTASGARFVIIEEVSSRSDDAKRARVVYTPARLHGDQQRFSAARTGQGNVLLREWHLDNAILGFTLMQEQR